jgi:hypothetical protein
LSGQEEFSYDVDHRIHSWSACELKQAEFKKSKQDVGLAIAQWE